MDKPRLVSIDLLKISAALIVFLFHCNMHLGVYFGILTAFISQGAIVMDLFFMLSGFSLQYSSKDDLFSEKNNLKKFYSRRIVAIYPLYLTISAIYFLIKDQSPFGEKMLRLPVELLLLQSAVAPGLFSYSHNGGTWFLSCLMISYLVFPVFNCLLKGTLRRTLIGAFVVTYILCSVFPFIVIAYALPNIYSNAVLRTLQFFGGMLLADLMKEKYSSFLGVGITVVSVALLVGIVDSFVRTGYYVNQYVPYAFVTFPLFAAIIFGAVCIEKGAKTKPAFIYNASKLEAFCYPIFMAQFLIWSPIKKIIARFPVAFQEDANIERLLLASVVCVAVALVFHWLISSPCQKAFRNYSS